MAEWAGLLGKMVGHLNQIQPNSCGRPPPAPPCIPDVPLPAVQDVVPGRGPRVVRDPGERLPRVHDQGAFNQTLFS